LRLYFLFKVSNRKHFELAPFRFVGAGLKNAVLGAKTILPEKS